MTDEQLKAVLAKNNLTIDEMASVIERYIFDRKKVNVRVARYVEPNLELGGLLEARNFHMMNHAYNVAMSWYAKNPIL